MPLATYTITNHPMLGPDATALDPTVFDAQVLLAEIVLGVHGSDYKDAALDAVKLALAVQVRYQVELDVDAFAVSSKTDGARSTTYRPSLPDTHPFAAKLIATLPQSGKAPVDDLHANWETVRTLRPAPPATEANT